MANGLPHESSRIYFTDGGMETPDGWLLSIGLKVYWDDFN